MVGIVALVIIVGLRWTLLWLGNNTFGWQEALLPTSMAVGWVLVEINGWKEISRMLGSDVKLPIKNVLVGLTIAIVGVFLAYSGASLIGLGMTLGLGWRLWSELLWDAKWQSWYSLVKREFTRGEHKWVMTAWLAMLIVQSLRVL